MLNVKSNKGITLMVLVITIIVLLIIAGITISTSDKQMQMAKLEGLKTNMLLIQAKAKENVENASFELGVTDNPTENMIAKANNELKGDYNGKQVSTGDAIASTLTSIGISSSDISAGHVYQLSTENLEAMGINNVKSDEGNGIYIIVYDLDDVTAEIYKTVGYDGKYSLTDIQNIEE